MPTDREPPAWRRLLCRLFGHRWHAHMDLTKPAARCDRCGAYARLDEVANAR